MKKRLLSLLLALVMLSCMAPLQIYAESIDKCISVSDGAVTAVTIKTGELYNLNLNRLFSDVEGHSLSYRFVCDVTNEHTKIVGEVFYFSVKEVGTYEVKLIAGCSEGEFTHTLIITVEKAGDGIAAQYNYDETDKSEVTVYVTLSNDGFPLLATDGTIMSHMEVTVPYFDLGLYGLGSYYRYETNGGKGIYTGDKIIQRPTGLHLYIYLLERYYMGLEEDECCKGLSSGVLQYSENVSVYYVDGELAYDSGDKAALTITGGATSLYMTNFWGHDENLMYYRNHCYPYMDAGWGSTSDYILLSDGDTWDVAMFTNWNFYHTGFFASFDKDEYSVLPESQLTVQTQKWGTSAAATAFEGVNDLQVALYSSDWELLEELTYNSDTDNSITFNVPKNEGVYYLMATDPNAKDHVEAKIAPATAKLVVTQDVPLEEPPKEEPPKEEPPKEEPPKEEPPKEEPPKEEPPKEEPKQEVMWDLNGDEIMDNEDVYYLINVINGSVVIDDDKKNTADISKDGVLNMLDVSVLLKAINGENDPI